MIKDNKIVRTKDYSDTTLKQSTRHCLKNYYLESINGRVYV